VYFIREASFFLNHRGGSAIHIYILLFSYCFVGCNHRGGSNNFFLVYT
jgi:hypothetical protein